VELSLHFPIRLSGVVLNVLEKGAEGNIWT
jgi:hypothetical protein